MRLQIHYTESLSKELLSRKESTKVRTQSTDIRRKAMNLGSASLAADQRQGSQILRFQEPLESRISIYAQLRRGGSRRQCRKIVVARIGDERSFSRLAMILRRERASDGL